MNYDCLAQGHLLQKRLNSVQYYIQNAADVKIRKKNKNK